MCRTIKFIPIETERRILPDYFDFCNARCAHTRLEGLQVKGCGRTFPFPSPTEPDAANIEVPESTYYTQSAFITGNLALYTSGQMKKSESCDETAIAAMNRGRKHHSKNPSDNTAKNGKAHRN